MPECARDLYIELPEADRKPGEDMVGKLRRNMYGFRDASNGWMKHWQELLRSDGYEVGKASGALFYDSTRDSRGAVHGDDFFRTGHKESLSWMKKEFEKEF